jgi:hypothetical protein
MGNNRLPDGYLEFCSVDALESLLLARMNQAANLCAHAKQLLHQWVEVEAEAKVARWMLERRRAQQLRAGESSQTHFAQLCIAPPQPELLAPPAVPAHHSTIPLHLALTDASRSIRASQSGDRAVVKMTKAKANDRPPLQRATLPLRASQRRELGPVLPKDALRIQRT